MFAARLIIGQQYDRPRRSAVYVSINGSVLEVDTHTDTQTHTVAVHCFSLLEISGEPLRWWFGLVVTSLGVSTKLLYVEPG